MTATIYSIGGLPLDLREEHTGIRYAVSAVEARRTMAQAIAVFLGGDLYMDDPPSGSGWNNYRNALAHVVATDLKWLVLLEDDAEPVPGFRETIPRALAAAPGDFVSFFYGSTVRMESARAAGASWVQTIKTVHGVCWAIKTTAAAELVAWAERSVPAGYRMNDDILRGWLLASGRWNYASVPSLVEHRQDLMSVMEPGLPNLGRKAGILPTGDPRLIEWTTRAHLGLGPTSAERIRAEERTKLAATGLTNLGG